MVPFLVTVMIYKARNTCQPSQLDKWRHCSGFHLSEHSSAADQSSIGTVNGIQSCGPNPPPHWRVIPASFLHLSISGLMIQIHFISLRVLLLLGDTVPSRCFRESAYHSAQLRLPKTVREGIVFANHSSQTLQTPGSELSPVGIHLSFQKFEFCWGSCSGKAQDTLACKLWNTLTKSFPLTVYWPQLFSQLDVPKKQWPQTHFSAEKSTGEDTNIAFVLALNFKLTSNLRDGSNVCQDKICKIPSGPALLPRVTTPAWTPACKTPFIEKAATQRKKNQTCP